MTRGAGPRRPRSSARRLAVASSVILWSWSGGQAQRKHPKCALLVSPSTRTRDAHGESPEASPGAGERESACLSTSNARTCGSAKMVGESDPAPARPSTVTSIFQAIRGFDHEPGFDSQTPDLTGDFRRGDAMASHSHSAAGARVRLR